METPPNIRQTQMDWHTFDYYTTSIVKLQLFSYCRKNTPKRFFLLGVFS